MTRIETELFAHMRHEHLGIFRATLTAENWSGTLTLRSALDGRVSNSGVERYQAFDGQHLEALDSGRTAGGDLWLRVRTVQSRVEIALACRHRLQTPAGGPTPRLWRDADAAVAHLGEDMPCEIGCGQQVVLEKRIALTTSSDRASSECVNEALVWVSHWDSYHALRTSHLQQWERLWRRCDLVASLRSQDLMALRLHIFQLLQTASLNTVEMDAGIPARGWHGEGYRGHVFWDELFVLPFLNFRLPELARALLLYRYRRLPAARRAARAAGYDGAMYPWQSGADGSEETQRWEQNPRSGNILPDHTYLQRHIGAAVAYNVCCYYAVTGDREFLNFYGLEMLLEIARFWASLAVEDRISGRFEIHGVMGPDEFHDRYPDAQQPGLRNNAYTNVMAAWVLWRTLELLHAIPEERSRELRQLFGVGDDELARWDRISRRMHVPFHGNVISQFEGYAALQELDWDAYRQRAGRKKRMIRPRPEKRPPPCLWPPGERDMRSFSAFSMHAALRRCDRSEEWRPPG